MNLRFDIRAFLAGPRRAWGLLLLAGALLVLVPFAGRAKAGVSDYPSPLYLAGTPSTVTGHGASYRLVGTLLSAPNTSVAAGAGTLNVATYRYLYTVDTGSGETASAGATAIVANPGETVTLDGLPTGTGVTVRLYRMNLTNPTNCYTRVQILVNNAQTTYTDAGTSVSCTSNPLKRSEDRFPQNSTGWSELSPGVAAPGGPFFANTPFSATAPTTPNKKGWIVDGLGEVSFPAGAWTFETQTRSTAPEGAALLVVAMWKVDSATGNPVGAAVLPPTEQVQAPASLITGTNVLQSTSLQVNVPSFVLESNERLYVQFWRHQTTPYGAASGSSNRVLTMFSWDGVAKITHPAASAFPTAPTPVAPAAGTMTISRDLSATFNDPESDSGTVEFRLCSDAAPPASACAGLVDSGSSASVSSGAKATWTSSAALAHGATYHWQARGRDASGGTSPWTATQSFLVNAAPSTPVLLSPDAGAAVTELTIETSYDDPDGDHGTLEVRLCSREAIEGVECPTDVPVGWFNSVDSGETVRWRPPALADGVYHWQVRVSDALGATSAWSATRVVRVDTTAPAAPAGLEAVLGEAGLVLRWQAPPGGDEIARYVVYVDGEQAKELDSQTFEAALGSFDADDARTFSVGAIDTAGNRGAKTISLVGVPSLVGLTRDQARAAVAARGLVLRAEQARTKRVARLDDVVLTQSPEAPSLLATGSEIKVLLAAHAKPTALLRLGKVKVSCATLTIQTWLGERSRVSVALLNRRGARVASWQRGQLAAGSRQITVRLRPAIRPGRYSVSVTAATAGRTERLSLPLVLGRAARSRCS